MDELSIDRAMMWPTLASLLEERLADDPVATHVVIHALNQWMHEQWTFNFDEPDLPHAGDRLTIVDEAIRGARVRRRARRQGRPHPARPGRPTSTAAAARSRCPEFDPFWAKVQEADVVVGMHASDSGHQRYLNEWKGLRSEFLPFKHEHPASTCCCTPSTA